jgi:translation initiation factor 2 subunit 2
METYEDLLERGMSQIPKTVFESTRFQIPSADVITVGNRTIIRNFGAISTALNREPEHIMKYFLRELGAAGELQGAQATFQGKFSAATIDERFKRYAEEFVLCRECHKPDTRIEKRERVSVLRCEACGARTSLRGV